MVGTNRRDLKRGEKAEEAEIALKNARKTYRSKEGGETSAVGPLGRLGYR